MPRYNQLKGDPKIEWLEKLPKKAQLLVLMLIMLAAAAVPFFMGLHSVHTGQDIVLGTRRISAIESFIGCAPASPSSAAIRRLYGMGEKQQNGSRGVTTQAARSRFRKPGFTLPSSRAKWIEDTHSRKMLLIVGYEDAPLASASRQPPYPAHSRPSRSSASDIRRPHTSAALSSNASTRLRNSACGPSGPENQSSSSLRFLPEGFSRIPRQISARLSEEMNTVSSAGQPAIPAEPGG